MLSMKTLRVAIAVVGSAVLLLGSGFAAATVQHLDGTRAGGNAPMAAEYAYELLTAAPGQSLTAPVGIMSPNTDANGLGAHKAHKLVVGPNRVIAGDETSLYLRLSFGGGMVFSKQATTLDWKVGARPGGSATCAYDADTADEENDLTTVTYPAGVFAPDGLMVEATHSSGGSKGDNYVVYRLDLGEAQDYDGDGSVDGTARLPTNVPMFDASETDPPSQNTDDDPANDVADNNNSEECDIAPSRMKLWVDVVDYLAIPASTGSYTAMISLHSDPDEAQAGESRSSAVYGSATIVNAVAGLDVEVKAEQSPAVAHVGTSPKPFLWFRNPTPPPEIMNSAVLGMARADVGREDLFNPMTGDIASGSDLIPNDSLTFTVRGDLSIGAFNMATSRADSCVAAGKATDEKPRTGNIPSADNAETNAKAGVLTGQDSGTYYLCVQVDVRGPNANPIPAGSYDATITQGTGATAKDLKSGIIGQIRRNGTTVKLTYLTVSSKYNQRLIIVNDGANDASYDIGPFVTEDGTTATAKAAASGTVSAGSQVVLRMGDLVEFEGPQARASATLSVNADVDDVQVATTQVNLEDGSTDTVVYAAIDGAIVQ